MIPDLGSTGSYVLGALGIVAAIWLAVVLVRALVPSDVLRRLLANEEDGEASAPKLKPKPKPRRAVPRPVGWLNAPPNPSMPDASAPDADPATATPAVRVPESAWAHLTAINRTRPGAPEAMQGRLGRMAEVFAELSSRLGVEGRDDTGFGHARTKVLAAIEAGQFERAQALLEHASDRDAMFGRRDPHRLSAVLGEAAEARALAGELKVMQLLPSDALRFYREAVALVPPDNPGLLMRTLDRWGAAAIEAGDRGAAMPPWQRALELRESALGPGHKDSMASRDRLIGLYIAARQAGEAQTLVDKSIAAEEAMTEADPDRCDPSALTIRIDELAHLLRDLGQHATAAALFQRALERLERQPDADPNQLAAGLSNLAQLRRELGELDAAIGLYGRALTLYRHVLGAQHPGLIAHLDAMAELHAARGDGEGALERLREAETIERTRLGDRHARVAERLYAIGRMQHALGRTAEAEATVRQGLAMHEAIQGPEHGDVAVGLGLLGRLCIATGQAAEALPLIERAVGIVEFARGLDHPALAPYLAALAEAYRALDRPADAEAVQRRIDALLPAPTPEPGAASG
jgi:tetratricopeptide (TPR) repeat protein